MVLVSDADVDGVAAADVDSARWMTCPDDSLVVIALLVIRARAAISVLSLFLAELSIDRGERSLQRFEVSGVEMKERTKLGDGPNLVCLFKMASIWDQYELGSIRPAIRIGPIRVAA